MDQTRKPSPSLKVAFLIGLMAAAGLGHAGQGVYLSMPNEALPRQGSNLVNDVARAYAGETNSAARAQVTQQVEVEAGRPSSVTEIAPGVLQFDLGKAPVVVTKQVPASQAGQGVQQAAPAIPATDEAAPTAPSSWRTGSLYGGQAAQTPSVQSPSLSIAVPVGRAAATVAVPLAKAWGAVSAVDASASSRLPIVAKETQAKPAETPTRLNNWPVVR